MYRGNGVDVFGGIWSDFGESGRADVGAGEFLV